MFLLLLVSLLAEVVVAQPQCQVVRYDEKDGVPSNHVVQLLQDTQGFMWFATWNGLCRYDGYEFLTFKPQAGDGCHMTTDRIRNIVLLPDEKILCWTDEGNYLFDLHSYRFLDMEAGARRYTDRELMKFRKSRSLLNRQGYSWTDRHQTQWTLSADGTLTYLQQGDAQQTHYPLSFAFNTLNFAMADRDGNLWALDNSGICHFITDVSRTQRVDITPSDEVKCLFADSKSHYWVTTKNNAAVRLYDVATDRLLGFLGADGRLHQQHISFLAPVYCMYEMQDGTLWLGTKGGGLFQLRSKGDEQYEIAHFIDIPHQDVYHIAADRFGCLWVAMLGGGVCYSDDATADQPHFKVPKNYPKEQCHRVRYLSFTDSLWMAATGSGLLVARMERQADQMQFRLHQRETERANSLSSSATMDVVCDSQGHYYVSTESGGVNMLESGDLLAEKLIFRHFNDSMHVQHNDNVQSMTALADGGLMAIGSHLLTLIDNKQRSRVLDAHHFHADYRFSEAHPLPLSGERLLIGLMDGAIITSMRQLAADSPMPTVMLTGLSIQGGSTRWDIARQDTLTLQPHERNITLRFAALDYNAPDRINYAFRVLPNEHWHYIGHDRSATLLDMEPGTYLLEVRSTNADGEWQDNQRRLTIIVTPTFWEAWYGQLLILLLIVSVVLAIVYTLLYIRRIRRQHRETLEKYLALIEVSGERLVEREETTEDPMLQRVMQYVEENLSNSDANVGEMAAAAAVSRSGLLRKLKQTMGVTPQELLSEARIKHACQLLRNTDKTISEIAYGCGFTDPKYFSRCFRQSQGCSPSEYREKRV
jgi:AraC-like DNA-binding protein/ligand-binding sensor domain-containing protein